MNVCMQAKTMELKQNLNSEFALIHELCLFVLTNSQKADLVRATLATLAAYLTWVPLGYVLESNITELLLKLFPPPATRNLALQCLTEVWRTSGHPSRFSTQPHIVCGCHVTSRHRSSCPVHAKQQVKQLACIAWPCSVRAFFSSCLCFGERQLTMDIGQ